MREPVLLCGLGVRPAQDCSLETLEALGRCARVYTDIQDEEDLRWLEALGLALAPAARAQEIVRAARRGDRVAVAAWGHPCYTSRLSQEVRRLCGEMRVDCRMLPANSPIGSVLARAARFLGGEEGCQGIQAFCLEEVLSGRGRVNGGLPLVVFSQSAPAQSWRELSRRLGAFYPADHPVEVDCFRRGVSCTAPLGGLASLRLTGAVLFLEARRERLKGRLS